MTDTDKTNQHHSKGSIMLNKLHEVAREAVTYLESACSWLVEKFVDLWAAHEEALRTSNSYRRQVIVLTGAVLSILAVTAPLDAVMTAMVGAYVAAYASEHGWNNRPNYGLDDERGW